ncbi:MAG: hypothetical protein OXG88_08780 [Gammaproteobacteria bacterium]|nr:hypothetical protein [Gammaproteobacteria bacterium]
MSSTQISLNPDKLRLASRTRIVEAIEGFKGRAVSDWLTNQPQTRNGQFHINNDLSNSNFNNVVGNVDREEIIKVVASSGPCHCLDGWTYFSRSLSSLLSGDSHLARHLIYYAQLRAAMSLLSCNGIGIFNGFNFTVKANGEIENINTGSSKTPTHKAVWEALRLWSETPDFANQFLNSIKLHGKTLETIINEVFPGSTSVPLVSKIIGKWGIDLEKLSEDHDARNISSYAPHAFNTLESNLPDRWNLIQLIWKGLEPSGLGYRELDLNLLDIFLKLISQNRKEIYGDESNQQEILPEDQNRIEDYFSNNFSGEEYNNIDLYIVQLAGNESGDIHAMICRALILLRLSTGVVHSVFEEASFNPDDGDQGLFDTFALDRGLWTDNPQLEDVSDLWADVSDALELLKECIDENTDSQHGFIKKMNEQNYSGDQFLYLSQAERACIWGLGR